MAFPLDGLPRQHRLAYGLDAPQTGIPFDRIPGPFGPHVQGVTRLLECDHPLAPAGPVQGRPPLVYLALPRRDLRACGGGGTEQERPAQGAVGGGDLDGRPL